MKILVTGAKGFLGKKLCERLYALGHEVYEYDIDTGENMLDLFTRDCEFVYNLAGINRPKNTEEFMEGNCLFADKLLELLKANGNSCTVALSSSIQAKLDNDYGKSKLAGEKVLFAYSEATGAKVCVYRFPNIFGDGGRPNYNSAVATFCYNIANGLPIKVNDPEVMLNLVYVHDVVDELVLALDGKEHRKDGYCFVPTVYVERLGDVADKLHFFKECTDDGEVPTCDDFGKKLFYTFKSYADMAVKNN